MWIPQSEKQWLAVLTRADELFYGGAAGGMKTDLILGLAIEFHNKSLILRREGTQLAGIVTRSEEIIGGNGKLNHTNGVWRNLPTGAQIEMKGCKDESDKSNFQGRPHDFIAFDEVTEFLESQVDYIIGWNRTADEDQRVRVVYTGNPPPSATGRWIIKKFAPWLDKKFPNPAKPGELRWYAAIEGKETWVENEKPFEIDGEMVTPKSRTFIPSKVEDNPYYMATGYKARLQALPEPLRSQMLKGDFEAGVSDNPWQVIRTAWVEAAQARWEKREKPDTPLTSLGVDVARGGKDQTVLCKLYDNYFDTLEKWPATMTTDGPSVAALVVKAKGDSECIIALDIIGIGSSPYDFLVEQDVEVIAVNFAEGTPERDKSGQLAFRNVRAEAYWRLREALDPASGNDIALPPDGELLGDLTAPLWKITTGGILIESKKDIKKRLGRSTDCGDAVALALYALGAGGPWMVAL